MAGSCCDSLIGDAAALLCCKPASASGVAGPASAAAAALDDCSVLTQGSSVDANGLLLVSRVVTAPSPTTSFHLLSVCCIAGYICTAGPWEISSTVVSSSTGLLACVPRSGMYVRHTPDGFECCYTVQEPLLHSNCRNVQFNSRNMQGPAFQL